MTDDHFADWRGTHSKLRISPQWKCMKSWRAICDKWNNTIWLSREDERTNKNLIFVFLMKQFLFRNRNRDKVNAKKIDLQKTLTHIVHITESWVCVQLCICPTSPSNNVFIFKMVFFPATSCPIYDSFWLFARRWDREVGSTHRFALLEL